LSTGEIRDIDGNLIPGTKIIRQSKPRTEISPAEGSLNPPQTDMQAMQPYEVPSTSLTYPNQAEARSQRGRGGTYSTSHSLVHKILFHCVDAEGVPVSGVTLTSTTSTVPVDATSDLNGNIEFYLPSGKAQLGLGRIGYIKTQKMFVPKEISFTPRALVINIDKESAFTYFVDSGVLLEGEIKTGNPGNPGKSFSGAFPLIAATGLSVIVLYLATRNPKKESSSETQDK